VTTTEMNSTIKSSELQQELKKIAVAQHLRFVIGFGYQKRKLIISNGK